MREMESKELWEKKMEYKYMKTTKFEQKALSFLVP